VSAPLFPFSAVVGADDLKLALLLVSVDPSIGGVLLRGQKGSAKTTLARGLAGLLPGEAPFAELPLGATEDRLVGTLDLAAALSGDGVRFQPGLLAAAHGGVLYVDEVNLLADHLVDVLLDVATSGVNRVEREGISHIHPARIVLIGSMNPEEGELRPQLLDRFGLAVDVAASTDPASRAAAVQRRLDFDADPAGSVDRWADEESELRRRLAATEPGVVPGDLLVAVSELCASVGAEGLRADLVTARAAAALAGWEGRAEATADDVRRVAPLSLAHRRRRSPFEDPGIADDELQRALDDALGGADGGDDEGGPPDRSPADGSAGPTSSDEPAGPDEAPGTPDRADGAPGSAGGAERPIAVGAERPVAHLEAPRRGGEGSGRRSEVTGARGRTIGDRAPEGPVSSVAFGATVRAAATRRAGRPEAAPVERSDVREAVRETTTGNLVVLAVDTSGSMGAERRMEAATGAVLGLLLDAYQRRDRVALVAFRGDSAEVVLRPTSSVEVARARLAGVPSGGRTPLAAGIDTALAVASGGASATHHPLLVLVSDGRATSAPAGCDPLTAALTAAEAVRRRRVPSVVVDAEDGPIRLGLAREIARAMGARHLPLAELTADNLRRTLR
jgi:magnesium chelatase subunit D